MSHAEAFFLIEPVVTFLQRHPPLGAQVELIKARRAEFEMIKGGNDVRAGGKSGEEQASVYN